MIDYTKILVSKYSGSEWTLDGEEYKGLTWLSDTPKPTKAKLDGYWDEVQAEDITKAETKIQAKASAQAKLAALGLTVEDLTALGL
jgi:hypothetical protein